MSASLAQWLEHWSCKPGVESSNLSRGCKLSFLSYSLDWCTNDILIHLSILDWYVFSQFVRSLIFWASNSFYLFSRFIFLLKVSLFTVVFVCFFVCLFVLALFNTSVSASLAQWSKHWSCKPGVESSNLSRGCKSCFSFCPDWSTNDVLIYLLIQRSVHLSVIFIILVKVSLFTVLFCFLPSLFVLSTLNTSVPASLAQWLEHCSCKPGLESSNLSRSCRQFSFLSLSIAKLISFFFTYLFIHCSFVFYSVCSFIYLFSQ